MNHKLKPFEEFLKKYSKVLPSVLIERVINRKHIQVNHMSYNNTSDLLYDKHAMETFQTLPIDKQMDEMKKQKSVCNQILVFISFQTYVT